MKALHSLRAAIRCDTCASATVFCALSYAYSILASMALSLPVLRCIVLVIAMLSSQRTSLYEEQARQSWIRVQALQRQSLMCQFIAVLLAVTQCQKIITLLGCHLGKSWQAFKTGQQTRRRKHLGKRTAADQLLRAYACCNSVSMLVLAGWNPK